MQNLVTAIVRPHQLDAVKDALHGIGIQGMTVTDVRGFGRQRGQSATYRGAEYQIDFVPKIKLEIVVDSESVDQVLDTIVEVAATGNIGDGKIWVTDAPRIVRIRTGESGADAV